MGPMHSNSKHRLNDDGITMELRTILIGAGVFVGMFLLGLNLWPADAMDGTCWVEPSNKHATNDCQRIGKYFLPVLNTANVTLKDGSVHTCNTFKLSAHCSTFLTSNDAFLVLQGEHRECKFLGNDDGRCLEPGLYEGNKVSAVICWILAPFAFAWVAWDSFVGVQQTKSNKQVMTSKILVMEAVRQRKVSGWYHDKSGGSHTKTLQYCAVDLSKIIQMEPLIRRAPSC